MQKKWFLSLVLLLFLKTATACNLEARLTPPRFGEYKPTEFDPCRDEVDLGLNLSASASGPELINNGGTYSLGLIGPAGAQALAKALTPEGTFCSYTTSESTSSALERIGNLLDEGSEEEARTSLDRLYDSLLISSVGDVSKISRALQATDPRQAIRDLLNSADFEMANGLGDGQRFIDAAIQRFRSMANRNLNQGGLDEAMRLLQESQLLGQNDLAEKSLQRARDIWSEKLEADIQDFDPCIPNPEILKQNIRDLANSLATGMALGIPSSLGPGGSQYDAVMAKIRAALENLIRMAEGESPECEKSFKLEFHFMVTTASDQVEDLILSDGEIPFSSDDTNQPPTLSGEGVLEISGSGATQCLTWQNGGEKEVVISGTLSPGANGQSLLNIKLEYSGQGSRSVVDHCNPPATWIEYWPIQEQSPEFQMPMQDGYELEWDHAGPSSAIHNKLILHIVQESN